MEVIWFIIIVIIFGSGLLFFITKASGKKKWFNEADRGAIQAKLKEIDHLLENGNYSEAIIYSDKLVDFVLQKMNFKGNTMADRMRDAEKLIVQHYQDFWWAHKLRNQIAHELHFKIDENTARKAVRIFRSVLTKLKAL